MLKDWTLLEKVWISSFLIINVYLFFAFQDTLLGLISSTAGVLCVVLAGKGKMSTYYVGIIQASTYAYITYTYALYGETMLNALFYLPMQFIGIYMWRKHLITDGVRGEDIQVRKLEKKHWAYIVIAAAVLTIVYAIFLNSIGGKQAGLDSLAVVLSIIAQILMVKRYAEQWLLWIAVNVLTIILWITALVQSGGNDWNMVLMWTAFLINSIISYYNWQKIYKGQQASDQSKYGLTIRNWKREGTQS